jgi:hypothetical protein
VTDRCTVTLNYTVLREGRVVPVKTYVGVDVYIHVFLTEALAGGEWSTSRPDRFTHGERVPSRRLGGLQIRYGWHREKKSFAHTGTKIRTLRLARNQSLYQQRYRGPLYRMSLEERSIFWEVIASATLWKKIYMYTCPIPNRFRDRAISLYSSKIVDQKEILRTVSITGIYCSSDIKNSTLNINALWNSCEDMASCSSVQWNSYISETVRNRTYVHTVFFFA